MKIRIEAYPITLGGLGSPFLIKKKGSWVLVRISEVEGWAVVINYSALPKHPSLRQLLFGGIRLPFYDLYER